MSEMAEQGAAQQAARKSPWRFAPLVLIVLAFAAFFALGLRWGYSIGYATTLFMELPTAILAPQLGLPRT